MHAAKVIDVILEREGGFVHNRFDHGGKTAYGITEATAKRHGFRIQDVSPERARLIYRQDYWAFDWVFDYRLALKLMDISVNIGGPAAAIRFLQEMLAVLGDYTGRVDGVAGPQTKAAVHAANMQALLAALSYRQMHHYVTRVYQDPSQREFIDGWMIRGFKV